MLNRLTLLFAFFILCTIVVTPQKKFLFDATKAETAGNADWILDADSKNSPARYPTPDQATVTSSTSETYWTGALSAWGIDLVKLGYKVETLPSGTSITYGTTSNAQDLSNYDVYVVDEPNTSFTTAEKTAIVNFVKNGGGLFMICDHAGADRNNDGWDPIRVWNDLIRNNGVQSNPFGFIIDSTTVASSSETTTKVNTDTKDPIIYGPVGTVTEMMFSAGTTAHLVTSATGTAVGEVWGSSGTVGSSSAIWSLRATYGAGRVVFVGDSSPADDGTGWSGKSLYYSWTGEANGNHRLLHLNGSLWLAKVTGTVTDIHNKEIKPSEFALEQNYPNPFNPATVIGYNVPSEEFVTLKVYDALGNEVASLVNEEKPAGTYSQTFNAANLPSGTYIYRLSSNSFSATKKMLLLK
jgi:hypothetical protein